jgi:transposase-like protein
MTDRNNPKRSQSSEPTYSVMEFMRQFPDDAACLDFLWRQRFSHDGEHTVCPKCERERKFHRVKSRPSYSCDTCGHHIHPTAGTIYHRSATSLRLWFYASYLMTSTRCAISAKQLERELGVTYKTAWRMANLIRNKLMVQDEGPLSGNVEADETFVRGKPRAASHRAKYAELSVWQRRQRAAKDAMGRKVTLCGAVERSGKVRGIVGPDGSAASLEPALRRFVLPSSTIFTDEWKAYIEVGREFKTHHRIAHNKGVYVEGSVHTNTIEGFWSLVKNGIRGMYHSVSVSGFRDI